MNETLQANNEDIFLHLLQNRTALFFPTNLELLNQSFESTERTQKIIFSTEKETTENKDLFKLTTQNPHKLVFTTDAAMYVIKGGVDKVMNKLTITLEICKSLPRIFLAKLPKMFEN